MATKKKAAVKKAAGTKPSSPKEPPAGHGSGDSGATIHGKDGVIPCATHE